MSVNSFLEKGLFGVFPEGESMNGVFAFLKLFDGKYESRYQIEASLKGGDISYIYRYNDMPENNYFYTQENEGDIKITFNSSFYLTDYNFATAGSKDITHSYPSSWEILGINSRNTYRLDKRESFKFCDNNNPPKQN